MDDKLVIKMYTEILLTSVRAGAASWNNSVAMVSDMARTWAEIRPKGTIGPDEIMKLEELSGRAKDLCMTVRDKAVEYMEFYTTPREPSSYLPMIEEIRELNEQMIEACTDAMDWYNKLSVTFFNAGPKP